MLFLCDVQGLLSSAEVSSVAFIEICGGPRRWNASLYRNLNQQCRSSSRFSLSLLIGARPVECVVRLTHSLGLCNHDSCPHIPNSRWPGVNETPRPVECMVPVTSTGRQACVLLVHDIMVNGHAAILNLTSPQAYYVLRACTTRCFCTEYNCPASF